MLPLLTNKVAVITGGGGALGAGIAQGLAQAGAAVVIADVKAEAAQQVAASIQAERGRALAVACDVADSASVAGMVEQAVATFGGVDILVNNAAIYPARAWTEISEAEWDRVFAVNIKGYYLCARAVYPSMKTRGGGAIINISSITFFLGKWDRLLDYVSTKGAVVGFTKALARELGPEGIRVNCIAPGAFPTDAEKIHPDPEGYNRFVLENQAIKRRGTPTDMAKAVLFFASDLSDFVTGQSLLVDGGWAMQ
ncbi:MAG: SDR family NAD(P)-dependent oxidoreductase [Caldilineaceae bacterium]|jgi:NAD(P)-dependent dehydrogenase (short-subunit alcohol dehydrogenase family)